MLTSLVILLLQVTAFALDPTDYAGGGSYNDLDPHYQDWFANFTNCGISRKYATLSFDDGPYVHIPQAESDTTLMLDTLDKLDVPGSFMMLAYRIQLYPQLAQTVVQRGHTVGSHSFNHPYLMNGTIQQAVDQFTHSNPVFKNILGVTPKFMRPPYGEMTWAYGNAILSASKLTPFMWNFDTKDWAIVLNKERTEEQWAADIGNYVNALFNASRTLYGMDPPSLVVLAHEYHSTPLLATTYINIIKSRGYTFVDLDTCYNQWLADKKAVAQCSYECEVFGPDGTCAAKNWNVGGCSQDPFGTNAPIYPNCAANPCATLNGYTCDPYKKCVNNKPCVPQCTGKRCGDDGCGGTCAPGCGMGTCTTAGQCIPPSLPDLTKVDMCRPVGPRDFALSGSTDDLQFLAGSISATYELTGSWDGGFAGLFTFTNVGHCIDNLVIRVTTPAYSQLAEISGFTLVKKGTLPLNPTPSTVDIKWALGTPLGLEAPQAFTLQYIIDPVAANNLTLMSMPCFPVQMQVVRGSFGDNCGVNGVSRTGGSILTTTLVILVSIIGIFAF